MANLKRNMIELVKNVEEVLKGGEVETERFWTPPFIPFAQVREALQLTAEMANAEKNISILGETVDKMADFLVKVYGNQFTKDDIYERLHGPGAMETLQENIMFIAQGVESSSTKKFLAAKKN